MSYTIVYDKQFISTKRGILPMLLSGSNNVTTFNGTREVRAREWSMLNSDLAFKSAEEIIEFAKGFEQYDYEMFKEGSKWVMCKDYSKWIKNACKKSATLEDVLINNPYRRMTGKIIGIKNEGYGFKSVIQETIRTEDELLSFYDKAMEFLAEHKNEEEYRYHFYLSFDGTEPLNAPIKEGRVMLKLGKNYLISFSERTYTTCSDKNEALIFNNAKECKEQIMKTHPWMLHCKYKFVNI